MSCWNNPIKELNTVVIAPIHKHSNKTVELYSIKGLLRINKYTPAVTIVAAWINALTGVGPSIAIGNQTCKPICELLAIAPINKHIPTTVTTSSLINGANENTVE
jgi:hypothetical protein